MDYSKELQAAQKALAPAIKRLKAQCKVNVKIPAGKLVDLLYDLRNITKVFNDLVAPVSDAVAPAIKEIEEHFVQTLAEGEATGVQGAQARVQVTTSRVPIVSDWDAFYKHIKKSGEFELLNKAVNRDAVRERWEQKKQVPGVGTFTAKKVSCTRLKGK